MAQLADVIKLISKLFLSRKKKTATVFLHNKSSYELYLDFGCVIAHLNHDKQSWLHLRIQQSKCTNILQDCPVLQRNMAGGDFSQSSRNRESSDDLQTADFPKMVRIESVTEERKEREIER